MELAKGMKARDERGVLIGAGDTVRFRAEVNLRLSFVDVRWKEGKVLAVFLDGGLPKVEIDTGEFRYIRPSMLVQKVGE